MISRNEMISAYNEGIKLLEEEMFFMQQKNFMKLNYYFHNQIGHQSLHYGCLLILYSRLLCEAIFELERFINHIQIIKI